MASGATVGELGEFAVIDRIKAALPPPASPRVPARKGALGTSGVLVGIGDDAAVVGVPDGRAVVSTDMLVEGRHFRRDWSSPQDVGARTAAASLVDIAAMGGRTTTLVIALGVPPDLPSDWIEAFYQGVHDEAAAEGATVVGGDLVRSDRIVVSATAIGDLAGAAPVLRSGARAGDVVGVAGRLGWAAAGLSILSRGFRTPRALVDAHRRPQPPYDLAREAAAAGATAMIDVSDGLIADLRHIARASSVVIEVDSKQLIVSEPVAGAAAAFNAEPLIWVLTGGEDHAVAATFPSDAVPEGFVIVGRVVDVADQETLPEAGVVVDGRIPRGPGGHDHFAG